MNAYERALLKLLFVSTTEDGPLSMTSLFDALPGDTAPPAYHVLSMSATALEAAEPWLTPSTLPDGSDTDKRVEDAMERRDAIRAACAVPETW